MLDLPMTLRSKRESFQMKNELNQASDSPSNLQISLLNVSEM